MATGAYSPRKRLSPDFYSGAYAPPDSTIDMAPDTSGAYSPAYNPPVSPTAPSLGQPAARPDIIRDVYAPQLSDVGSKLESAYSAPHAGIARQLIGAFVGNRNPALGGIISGETQRERAIEPLEHQYKLISGIIQANRAMQSADIENRLHGSQADKASAEAAAEPIKAEAANYKEDPNLGLIDIRTKQPLNPAGLAPLTREEADVLGKQEGERVPLKLKNTANEIVNRGYTTVNTEEGVYERRRGAGATDMTRLGSNPRMMFAPGEQYTPVAADPNNPGNVTLMKKGQAAAHGVSLPQSAESQAAKAVTKSAVAGKIGDEINAFNTAIEHAKLLKQVATALDNGDARALNGLKNSWQQAFGSSNLNDFNVVAGAYSDEITKMLSSGHMTNQEIGKAGATLPSNANAKTLISAADKYKALADSKMQMRRQQVEKGQKGEANFPAETPATATSGKPTHIWTPQGLQPAP